MAKPNMEQTGAVDGELTVDEWMEANRGPQTPEGAPQRLGPAPYDGGPAPLSAPMPMYDAQEYLDSTERALPFQDPRVLCSRCRHGWIMGEVAPTRNKKADGSDFLRFKGICTFGGGRMSLQDIRPIQCNRFESQGEG